MMPSTRPLTGTHVLIGFVVAFGVIIAVNLWLAVSAVRTFPGLEVANSYVASQTFDARRAAQEKLGWTANVRLEAGALHLSLLDRTGAPVHPDQMEALLGRPTMAREDQQITFDFDGRDYVANPQLGAGRWILHLRAVAPDGTEFQQRLDVIGE